MKQLDGTWDVRRVGGLLPPLVGVRKEIDGSAGRTALGPLPGMPFDVVGTELRYRRPFEFVVDRLERDGAGWLGRTVVAGHELGRFRLIPTEEKTMTTIDAQLVTHIDEAIAMEENVKRMLDAIISTTDDPDVLDLLEHHRAETERHSARLRERLAAHGASPSVVREAAGMLGALVKVPLDLVRGEKAGRNARDAYAAEHLEIASYQLLERVATRAGDVATAQVARQNRAEEEAMARRLDERWDRFAELSLARARVPSSTV